MTKITAEDRLRRRRERLGLSRREAAELAGLKPSRIWASEKNGVGVDPETRAKIAGAYNKLVQDLADLPPIE